MKISILYILLSLLTFNSYAQGYDDYIGAGHNGNITITSSSDVGESTASKLLDGSGFMAERYEASRFLGQATLGFNEVDIDSVLSKGFEVWIDDQLGLTTSETAPLMDTLWEEIFNASLAYGLDSSEIYGPAAVHFNYAWWQNLMTSPDQLRQKTALALSEILVASSEGIASLGTNNCYYFDRFLTGAFGSYKDLLSGVSLDPNMGHYLSHFENPKTDTTNNIHPDENFAREIMQLFTIGLYKLNMDGTRQTDVNGDDIPTYDNLDIKGMAKVFTGLSASEIYGPNMYFDTIFWGIGYWGGSKVDQMIMYDDEHEPGPKPIFDGHIIPDGQTGMEDFNQTIDLLFDHPNVAPFICRRLIQNFVKSNPTPAYIERVANVFADNGSGMRGDIGAVVKAILMDDEARKEIYIDLPATGKLRSPITRYTNLVKAIPNDSPSGRYWNAGFGYNSEVGQYTMMSPSVFNFYLPDYQPIGEITAQDLVAPEFQIHNSKNILNYYNFVHSASVWDNVVGSWVPSEILDTEVNFDTNELELIASNAEALMNKLDLLFTHGTLSDRTKDYIKESIVLLNDDKDRVRHAIYLLLISPDYAIMR